MTLPVQSRLPAAARGQGPDLAKLRAYLLNAVVHEMEMNPPLSTNAKHLSERFSRVLIRKLA